MPDMVTRLLLGALAALLVAAVARRRRSLTRDGAVAATVVGTIVVGGGGWWWGVILVAFFASSSALSRLPRRQSGARRNDSAPAITARGAERDAVQVAANGGIATLIAASGSLPGFSSPEQEAVRFALFSGAIAAVTADTWATEIGRFSRAAPRLITTGRMVTPGVSGGITPLGTGGSALGGTMIGLLAAIGASNGWVAGTAWPLLLGTTIAGLAGSLADSLLGATLQAAYHCPHCQKRTERRIHTCGTPTTLIHGHDWITNDVVNLAASLTGAAVGFAAWLLSR